MKVVVLLFAGVQEQIGQSQLDVNLPDGATVDQLRAALLEDHPASRPLLSAAMFAVDSSYVDGNEVIPAGAEVACIPPVSGG